MTLLEKLYKISSPSGQEKNMRKFIKEFCKNNVPDAIVKQDKARNIYITKGEDKTYPCVVAHMDEVHDKNKNKEIVIHDNLIFGLDRKAMKLTGIGADDKNGIWVALNLLTTEKVLKCAFFVGEETGCIGSHQADMVFFSDVRFVVHFDVPDSPEAYFQEAGRGGRDGKRSFAVMLWNSTDIKRMKQIATVSFPSLEYIEDIYHKVHSAYEIPYDTGAGRQLKFNLEEFCRKYGLQRSSAYYALTYLERTDHLTLSEDVDISTKVQIRLERNELYDIEFPDPKMILLLETLMRKYTGLFAFPVPIDEDYIAGRIGVTVPMLRQLLYNLALEHVIKYIPSDHATVLFLHHDRLRPKNLNLDPERYQMLKDSSDTRMQKMLDYITEEDTCRSAYLLDYFGQKESADCGTCDVCRSSKKSSDTTLKEALVKFVNDEMSGSYTLEDVARRFGSQTSSDSDTYIRLLRRLIDEGTLPAPGL